MGRLVRELLLLLLLVLLLVLSVEGKKKKSSKEWSAAWKKLEQADREEYEEEREERMAEHAKYQDPMKMLEMGTLMGGFNNGGVAMCFVKMKPEITREETEGVVLKWRDLLATAGFDITPYVVEDQLVLLTLEQQWKVNELKDFVLDPYFAQGKVLSFDYNSKSWYPAGSEEALKEDAKTETKKPKGKKNKQKKKNKKGQTFIEDTDHE